MLKRGINFGNHFEKTPVPGETYVNPMQDWYYPAVKKLGFDHIRLPVKWSSFTDDNNGYRIDESFRDMVEKAVRNFLDQGMAVVLNIHHFREAMDDPAAHQEKIYAIWQQLAAHFRDYPDKLIFEVMNEPTWRADAEVWNTVQNKAVEVIRRTNPERKVMIGGIDYTGMLALNKLVPPTGDKNLIASFHYYFPLDFTHQGASWSPTYKDVKGIRWGGTPAEVADIYNGIRDNAKAWSERYGIPMNLGEFGALSTADLDSRVLYTRCVRQACEQLDISWTYWEFNGGFGICQRSREEYLQPLADALLKNDR